MTLHEAIVDVLFKAQKPLTATEIANKINKNSSYAKGDGSVIKSSQIGARVKNYPHLFIKDNSFISLQSKTGIKMVKLTELPKSQMQLVTVVHQDVELLCKVLMNEKNFKSPKDIENLVPNEPGMYCIRIMNSQSLCEPFCNILSDRNHNIIYIGIASQSLKKRFLGQELRAKGHGTFFRSIGAVLGYTPEKGSLMGKKNQNNYQFSTNDEKEIINWINSNLVVNWVSLNQDFNRIENELIQKHVPLLNIAGNQRALKELVALRDNCKAIARG